MTLDSRNAELNKKIKDTDLSGAVAVLVNDAKKRKRQLRWLAISIALDFILTIGLTLLSLRTQNLAIQAESNEAALVRNCETGNEARANNKQLWTYIIELPPSEPRNTEAEKRLEDFKVFLDKTFAPRDCQELIKMEGKS